jgi:hypothetical protein
LSQDAAVLNRYTRRWCSRCPRLGRSLPADQRIEPVEQPLPDDRLGEDYVGAGLTRAADERFAVAGHNDDLRPLSRRGDDVADDDVARNVGQAEIG